MLCEDVNLFELCENVNLFGLCENINAMKRHGIIDPFALTFDGLFLLMAFPRLFILLNLMSASYKGPVLKII